jgi:DNA-binding transcriptional LysR family regulator
VSDLSAADRAAIRDVISRQMAAFQRDAAAEAFAFAAPGIRAIFGTPDAFMAMVRTGYMPVYRPRRADFEDPVGRQGRIVQPVRIVGPDGATVLALYDMEAQPDGTWLIAGCSLVAPPGGDA